MAKILKSTALIGGSSVLRIVFGIVRTKALAFCWVQPAVGLVASTRQLSIWFARPPGWASIRAVSGRSPRPQDRATFGIWRARTATLRRVAVYSGWLGAPAPCLLQAGGNFHLWKRRPRGRDSTPGTGCFLCGVSAGQMALVQGMRRVADLARIKVFGAVFGTLFSVPLVFFFGERGVAPFLVCVAAGESSLHGGSPGRSSYNGFQPPCGRQFRRPANC